MPRHVVLLRGINVGRNQQIAMGDLRALLEGLGHTDVVTVLRSGNALFTPAPEASSDELERQIEAAIAARLGLTVSCMVRSEDELRAVIAANPLLPRATDLSRLMAIFLSAAPDPGSLAAHDPTAAAPDDIALGDRVIYQWCPDGVLAAPAVAAFAERHLGVRATARNWKTVSRLAARLDP